MKQTLPDSLILPGHPDYDLLTEIAGEITARAGGAMELASRFPAMLRTCIDDVIMTPKTGRRAYEELEKTEKTYIGTRVEIELRALLRLPRGRLDTEVLGRDMDIKNTMGSNWMIPTEALDQVWEESEVIFGPDPNAGCPQVRDMLANMDTPVNPAPTKSVAAE